MTYLANHVDDVAARPAHRLPKLGDGVSAPTLLVHLHHPGYRDTNQSILFTLPTCSINSEEQPCADYWLAWQGCYALAIERKGFFTTRPQRNSTKVAHGQGLVEGHYWYHLDNQDEQDPYATLQSFRSWQYNPDTMPISWSHAIPGNGEQEDDQRDGDCCMTGEDFTQRAHLIPKTEWEWWADNNMSDYAGTSGVTRATATIGQEMLVPGNLISLSDGLHRLWDYGFFCLFPLKMPDGQWRLHSLFILPLQKMVRLHHRRPLRGGLADVSPACAWARFVFSVCRKYETTFLAKRVSRKLGGSLEEAQWLDAEQISKQRQDWVRNTSPTKRSKSGSPRKRDRSQSREDRADSAVTGDFEADEIFETELVRENDFLDADSSCESPERGRLRSREEDENRKRKCWAEGYRNGKRRRVFASEVPLSC